MEIYRPKDGIYRSVNDSGDTREYVLRRPWGCFPFLTSCKEWVRPTPIKDFQTVSEDKPCFDVKLLQEGDGWIEQRKPHKSKHI